MFKVNFEHISHFSSVSIVNFGHVFAGWVCVLQLLVNQAVTS